MVGKRIAVFGFTHIAKQTSPACDEFAEVGVHWAHHHAGIGMGGQRSKQMGPGQAGELLISELAHVI